MRQYTIRSTKYHESITWVVGPSRVIIWLPQVLRTYLPRRLSRTRLNGIYRLGTHHRPGYHSTLTSLLPKMGGGWLSSSVTFTGVFNPFPANDSYDN